MTLDKIIAITGKPGLYQIISQNKSSLVAESLIDKKRRVVTLTQQLSALKDIAIYTYEEEIPLNIVFKTMFDKDKGTTSVNSKASNKELFDYFREILPEFDEDRVYASSIKKIINWYNLLNDNNFDFTKVADSKDPNNETES